MPAPGTHFAHFTMSANGVSRLVDGISLQQLVDGISTGQLELGDGVMLDVVVTCVFYSLPRSEHFVLYMFDRHTREAVRTRPPDPEFARLCSRFCESEWENARREAAQMLAAMVEIPTAVLLSDEPTGRCLVAYPRRLVELFGALRRCVADPALPTPARCRPPRCRPPQSGPPAGTPTASRTKHFASPRKNARGRRAGFPQSAASPANSRGALGRARPAARRSRRGA